MQSMTQPMLAPRNRKAADVTVAPLVLDAQFTATATALVDSAAIVIVADDGAGAPVPEESDQWAVGLAAAIDHPPQLA